ncbi:hypothetical protein SO802_032001 [Lithocarpus litseifolius]|uniref:Aminotransferase-like plant mobile domain-containing protein n=1 Tax=Lithocarpus litseifolius TaxID=425828 RepID=A0AAW2BM57_9ROSI
MSHDNFAFPLSFAFDPVTPNEEKIEIGSDIVDSDEFNLPLPDSMAELRLRRQEQSQIYGSVLVSHGLNMKKDIAGLRRLVRRWNLATHTFFFAWSEATITLEDIEKILLLPLVGCRRLWSIMSVEGSEGIIEQLYTGYGGRDVPPFSWERYNPHRVRRQFGYDQGVSSENPMVLDHKHSVTPFVLQTGRSCLNKVTLLALLLENPRVGVLTRRACRYWNEIAVRFNDYVAVGKVPEPWKKYEPMAKARVSAPSAHGEALNAKPPANRERLETSVNAFAFPHPLPKKDDALAPLNCAVTMRPLPGLEVPDNQVPSSLVVFEEKVDIPELFEDDLSNDCEKVVVPIVAASPFITIEHRSLVGPSNEMTSESYDGTSESSARTTGTLDVSKGVDAVGEATNVKFVIAKTSVTLDMGVEALVDATIVPDSQIEPMSTCLDSLTHISDREHIEAFLGRFEQDKNNELKASHVYNFAGPSTRIHRFSVPSESVPLLEHLRTRHNDFIRARDTEIRDGLATKKSSRCRHLG